MKEEEEERIHLTAEALRNAPDVMLTGLWESLLEREEHRKAAQRLSKVSVLSAISITAMAIGIIALNICFWVQDSRLDHIEESQQRQEAAYSSNDAGNDTHDAPLRTR